MATGIIIACCVVLFAVGSVMRTRGSYLTGQVAKRDLERDGD